MQLSLPVWVVTEPGAPPTPASRLPGWPDWPAKEPSVPLSAMSEAGDKMVGTLVGGLNAGAGLKPGAGPACAQVPPRITRAAAQAHLAGGAAEARDTHLMLNASGT